MSKKFEFTRNQKGENTLIRKGFHHNKNVTNKNGTTQWRCVNRKLCGASITIDKSRKKILRETKHCCTGNKDKIKLHNIKESLKTAVCNDLGPIQIIFEREVEEMGVAALVSYKSVKHSLYRARKNFLNTNFLNYSSTENVHIPEVLGKKFLICEDGDVEKILIFATKLGRKLMRKRGLMFFADGTFKAAPKPFYQLYVLHVDLGSSKKATNIVPVIYVLLPNKTEQTYTRLFKLLKEKLMIKIRNFKSDYEKAQMNAVSKIFPEAKISGCFYHYNHAIWRYSKRIKLNATRKGRNVTRMCSLMPLVPADRIPEAWQYILEAAPDTLEMRKFRTYYENEWYPKQSPNVLSCAGQRHRTTNALEGWHNRLNRRTGFKHPYLYDFIFKLKLEAKHFDGIIADSLFTEKKDQRRIKDIVFDRKYKICLKKLETNKITIKQFLKKIIFLRLVK